jgi:hypothetical protein
VQSVVDLTLQVPGELGMIEIAGVDGEHIGVDWDGGVLQVDQDFDCAVVFSGGEGEQGVLVELQMIEDFLQRVGHGIIVNRSTQIEVAGSH